MHPAYKKLALVVCINAVVMFLLTYALIDRFDHFYPNINRTYMAVMMVAPMIVMMLAVMGDMYPNKKLNYVLMVFFGLLFVAVFSLGRGQTMVGDHQFLLSMIPHHSSAIVMCEHSSISAPDIISLCEDIVRAQKNEIEQMQEMLQRY